jgi:hypothetical protein
MSARAVAAKLEAAGVPVLSFVGSPVAAIGSKVTVLLHLRVDVQEGGYLVVSTNENRGFPDDWCPFYLYAGYDVRIAAKAIKAQLAKEPT